MPYIDYKTKDTWQKRLFDKLMSVEDKLDRLLVLQVVTIKKENYAVHRL